MFLAPSTFIMERRFKRRISRVVLCKDVGRDLMARAFFSHFLEKLIREKKEKTHDHLSD
jgi:hypothetical protein